jgi:uncharacterized protein (TIGR00730 family)
MTDHDPFPSARDDASAAHRSTPSPQTASASYRLAFADPEFLLRDELRPVRLQLELLKPELLMEETGIVSTIVFFGSARMPQADEAAARLAEAKARAAAAPDDGQRQREAEIATRIAENSRYYEAARTLARLVAERSRTEETGELVVMTGGGAGIMEAANRGAAEAGAKSIGLNIVLPFEQRPNPYITPDLSFQFHYFAIRKMHFLMRARALVLFPGGFGTLDELLDALTLIQTGKMSRIPIVLFGPEFWRRVIDFEALHREGMISEQDLGLIEYADTPEAAWRLISAAWERR